jgi:hypothetical protein
MSTFIESPRVAFVSGSSLPASSPFSLYRLILPVLCIAIGASVGTTTGIVLALANAPSGVVQASSDSGQANPISAKASINVAANTNPASVEQTAVVSPLAASSSQPAGDAGRSTAKATDLRPSTAGHVVKAQPPSATQVAYNKAPEAAKPATIRLAGKEWHAVRPTSVPVSDPVPHQIASAPLAPSTALDSTPSSLAQSSLDDAAKPASIYIEGEVTVAGYDAMTGTLQASDGRTFILGTTVAAGNAASWNEYRSDVHYRCDQSGSCMLMRAGAVAPNARLI